MKKDLIDAKEAARRIGVGPRTLPRWVRERIIDAAPGTVGQGKRMMFAAAMVDDFASGQDMARLLARALLALKTQGIDSRCADYWKILRKGGRRIYYSMEECCERLPPITGGPTRYSVPGQPPFFVDHDDLLTNCKLIAASFPQKQRRRWMEYLLAMAIVADDPRRGQYWRSSRQPQISFKHLAKRAKRPAFHILRDFWGPLRQTLRDREEKRNNELVKISRHLPTQHCAACSHLDLGTGRCGVSTTPPHGSSCRSFVANPSKGELFAYFSTLDTTLDQDGNFAIVTARQTGRLAVIDRVARSICAELKIPLEPILKDLQHRDALHVKRGMYPSASEVGHAMMLKRCQAATIWRGIVAHMPAAGGAWLGDYFAEKVRHRRQGPPVAEGVDIESLGPADEVAIEIDCPECKYGLLGHDGNAAADNPSFKCCECGTVFTATRLRELGVKPRRR